MKNIFSKIGKGILYFFGIIFIFSVIGTDWNPFWSIISIMFCVGMFPIVYRNVKEFTFKKYEKMSKSKFVLSYVLIVFFGYIISFSVLTNQTAIKEQEEKQQIESITKLDVIYNEINNFTTKDELEINIKGENIKKLTINGEEVKIENGELTYNFLLTLGENNISIIGYNGKVKREFNRKIEKITEEEVVKRIEEQKQAEELAKKEEIERQAQQLQEEIDKIKKETENLKVGNGSEYKNINEIYAVLILMEAHRVFLEKYKNNDNTEIKKQINNFEQELVKYQQKEFPKMRQAYGKIQNNKLWVDDGKAKVYGSANGTIDFIWSRYALNKNILTDINTIRGELELLRFDRVNFKRSESSYAEYTYYTLKVPRDNEIVKINF